MEGKNTLNYYIVVAIRQIRRNALPGADSRISKGMDKFCLAGVLNYYTLVAIRQIRRNALPGANSRIPKGMDKVCLMDFSYIGGVGGPFILVCHRFFTRKSFNHRICYGRDFDSLKQR